ncbi:Purine nucleoside phosphorylase [Micrococcus lylae]|uniref:Purine nucleoside phosphorylase n=1 Tax=Micrococcus lylae TaxID=1273 RepID=A0A1R4ISP7_9MICC|nr:Purine nucleoside phosphorylase [Micrococcus lylae]
MGEGPRTLCGHPFEHVRVGKRGVRLRPATVGSGRLRGSSVRPRSGRRGVALSSGRRGITLSSGRSLARISRCCRIRSCGGLPRPCRLCPALLPQVVRVSRCEEHQRCRHGCSGRRESSGGRQHPAPPPARSSAPRASRCRGRRPHRRQDERHLRGGRCVQEDGLALPRGIQRMGELLRARPVFGHGVEAGVQQVGELCSGVRDQHRQRRPVVEPGRRPPGEAEPGDGAEGEHIRRGAWGPVPVRPIHCLRRGEPGGAACTVLPAQQPRGTQVGQGRPAVDVEQDVGRGDVPVHDALLMQGLQGLGDRHHGRPHPGHRERTAGTHERGQAPTCQQLGEQTGAAVGLDLTERRHEVAVAVVPQRGRLLGQALRPAGQRHLERRLLPARPADLPDLRVGAGAQPAPHGPPGHPGPARRLRLLRRVLPPTLAASLCPGASPGRVPALLRSLHL